VLQEPYELQCNSNVRSTSSGPPVSVKLVEASSLFLKNKAFLLGPTLALSSTDYISHLLYGSSMQFLQFTHGKWWRWQTWAI